MDAFALNMSPQQKAVALTAFSRAVAIAGSQSKLARQIGVSQQIISYWCKQGQPVPAKHVDRVEQVTGVSRHQLRPDVYPVERPHAPPAWCGVDRGNGHDYFQNGGVLQRNTDEFGAAA